jgi:Cu/Zn superoxide dismutase
LRTSESNENLDTNSYNKGGSTFIPQLCLLNKKFMGAHYFRLGSCTKPQQSRKKFIHAGCHVIQPSFETGQFSKKQKIYNNQSEGTCYLGRYVKMPTLFSPHIGST